MKEKVKLSLLIIVCIIAVIIMSIWMYLKWRADLNKPWIDRWDEQMK